MRRFVLQKLYKLFPFDLKGDCSFKYSEPKLKLTCIINFYGRLDLLSAILYSLIEQNFEKSSFEVILVEDRGGTDAGKALATSFSDKLNIVYLPLDSNFGKMGYSRNFGLSKAKGEVVLFLDDDTVILQHDFLAKLVDIFDQNKSVDALVPFGSALYAVLKGKYSFHDPYFMTSRCTAYRIETLKELGGFMNHFVGQEDVEFVTRFTIAGKRSLNVEKLHYYHPPLLVPNTRKPRAVGYSFYGLKNRYSLPVWLLLLLNCARHALLIISPILKHKEQGRFGIGFIQGLWDGICGKKEQLYG